MFNHLFLFFQIDTNPPGATEIVVIFIIILLLICSALISGSEVAFFALTPADVKQMQDSQNKVDKQTLLNIEKTEKLLATILIANNFVNINIVIFTTYLTSSLFVFKQPQWLGFVIEVIGITFLILMFGEILPKVYATYKSRKFATFMTYPMYFIIKILSPFSFLLVSSTSFINKRVHVNKKISIEDLSEAIDIALDDKTEKKDILQGIVRYGSVEVSEIMTPRIDVVAVSMETDFVELKNIIKESGYSRMPVYVESFDNIKGILYIKDLITHLNKTEYDWIPLLKEPYYVPETKKLDDMLSEFQTRKIHMAIVSDEYGGSCGIITLEDVLEEIVGEINDEFDEKNKNFKKINDSTYVFEAKIQLKDLYKVLQIEDNIFDDIKGEAETLAGLILEIRKDFPNKGEIIQCKNFTFHIESVDKRKINYIKVIINK